jgi:hypothetical protein
MSDETKHEIATGNAGFERQDLQASGVTYFFLGLLLAILLCIVGLKGVFAVLDHREKALQPAVNPLITNVPTDTRHVAPGYPQGAFPDPKLEEDERGQLNGIRLEEEKTLYSYGWVDEKAGTVRIPIDRAMDLIVERGLPVFHQGATSAAATPTGKKGEKK